MTLLGSINFKHVRYLVPDIDMGPTFSLLIIEEIRRLIQRYTNVFEVDGVDGEPRMRGIVVKIAGRHHQMGMIGIQYDHLRGQFLAFA